MFLSSMELTGPSGNTRLVLTLLVGLATIGYGYSTQFAVLRRVERLFTRRLIRVYL